VDNVVTAVARDGFFIQTPPERATTTLDLGRRVRLHRRRPAVADGDRSTSPARWQEFFDLTEMTGAVDGEVVSSGHAAAGAGGVRRHRRRRRSPMAFPPTSSATRACW
jgi:hypothetical protein